MEIYPVGMVALALWCVLLLRDFPAGVAAVAITLPLGMLAPMKLPIGGMTPLLSQFCVAAAIAASALRLARGGGAGWPTARCGAPLLLLLGYAVIATALFPRLFAGEFYVFSFGREVAGVTVSENFRAKMTLVEHVPANVSQFAYLASTLLFFFVAHGVASSSGWRPFVTWLVRAGWLNVALGALDLAGAGALLGPLRTAEYALHDSHALLGMPRVIGGFSEPAAFGAFSVAIGGFLTVYGLRSGARAASLAGLANLLFAGLSFSSTAYLGLAFLGAIQSVAVLRAVLRPQTRAVMFGRFAAIAAGVAACAAVAAAPGFIDAVGRVVDSLFISKAASESAYERGAMALGGYQAFLESGGLGLGVGTVRANGYLSALLAAVGAPGALLMTWFWWSAFFGAHGGGAAFLAARAGALSAAAVMAVSSFSMDPGNFTMIMAAIAASARLADRSAPVPPYPATRAASDRRRTLGRTPHPDRPSGAARDPSHPRKEFPA